jgi:hypothetical protein
MVVSEPPVGKDEKRTALEAALNSHTFARSAQLRAFLRYICEREIEGGASELTEYQIAVDVLGRRKDVNLTEDSSVRNRAYELRQRLEKYYATEDSNSAVRIEIPRGAYVPIYARRSLGVESTIALSAAAGPEIAETKPKRPFRLRVRHWIAIAAFGGAAAGGIAATYLVRSRPPAIVKEAWGPMADPADSLVISIATNFHMLVRPHIRNHALRLDAPAEAYEQYGSIRPLPTGTPLYMEPTQLSVPLGEVTAAATLSNMRAMFGGSSQILPETEAPIAALRGRNAALIGSGTNSHAASVLLHNLPFTIDYTPDERFGVLDQRKPTGQNALFVSQPSGDPVSSVSYGLLSVITEADARGNNRRTVVFSGSSSAGVQGAVEFFCSAAHMREMKDRFIAAGLDGFPSSYQVVVNCKTSGVRLISYEYAAHEIANRK